MELFERYDYKTLEAILFNLKSNYLGLVYTHKGSDYMITGVATLNYKGKGYAAFMYSDVAHPSIVHTRPVHEFLDGRFKQKEVFA